MKKLAFLFAAFSMFLQTEAQNRITKEQARVYLAQGMASFTNSVKPAYKKGQTYAQFEKALLGKTRNTKQGQAILKKAYGYLLAGTNHSTIMAKDAGTEMAVALSVMEHVKKTSPKSKGIELFGGTTGGVNPFPWQPVSNADCEPWWDIFCQFGNLIRFVGENKETLCFIIGLFGVPCPQAPVSLTFIK